MKPVERKPIKFSKWTPVRRDYAIGYSYIGPDGRKRVVGGDRWMRVKYRIASSAISSGAEQFSVHGGLGKLWWYRTVTCTEAEADEFFRHWIEDEGNFMLKGTYRKACSIRERRLAREAALR